MARQQRAKVLDVRGSRSASGEKQMPEKVSNRLKVRIDDLKTFDPLKQVQAEYFHAWEDDSLTSFILHGCAGTGKSFIALYKALESAMDPSSDVDGVIIVRSAVAGRDIGHLPGDEKEKLAVYEQPYIGICADLFGKADAYQRLKEQGTIKFISSSFVRGITLDKKIVIVDEMQNYNFQELYSIATRVGENTRIVFCGDFRQNDLRKRGDESGLVKFLEIMSSVNHSDVFEFELEDVVRSKFVKAIIKATMDYEDRH